jgi:putative FmdB family regulatory protein
MPYYDYECKACGKTFNFNHTFKENEEFDKKCPECGEIKLEKYYPLGTTFSKAKIAKNSKKYGGIFSKKFWHKNKWV